MNACACTTPKWKMFNLCDSHFSTQWKNFFKDEYFCDCIKVLCFASNRCPKREMLDIQIDNYGVRYILLPIATTTTKMFISFKWRIKNSMNLTLNRSISVWRIKKQKQKNDYNSIEKYTTIKLTNKTMLIFVILLLRTISGRTGARFQCENLLFIEFSKAPTTSNRPK